MEALERSNDNVIVKVPKKDVEPLASALYTLGVYSHKEASDLLGKTRREFDEILENFSLPVIKDISDDTHQRMKESQKDV